MTLSHTRVSAKDVCGTFVERKSTWIKTCSRLTLQTMNPTQAVLKLNSGPWRQRPVHRQATYFWLIHSQARASPYINITQLAFSDEGEVGSCGAERRRVTRGISWTCQQKTGKRRTKVIYAAELDTRWQAVGTVVSQQPSLCFNTTILALREAQLCVAHIAVALVDLSDTSV
jgi:hypothetical protein